MVDGDNNTGMIFNIQPFSIHDGPGLRTTLFLKGCPLNCPWCSNPESILPGVQPRLCAAKCSACGACADICPEGAIVRDETGRPKLDGSRCCQCLACVDACPSGGVAAVGRRVSARSAAAELLKDEPFYRNTGGGVTLSGGEPLAQPDFTCSVLAAIKEKGIHTAIDTTGAAPGAHLEAVLPHTDLVLYDIKHLDRNRHRRWVGASNEGIIDNLKAVAGRAELWIRVPLIPQFNDSFSLADDIVALGRSSGATRVCFLAVHRWGEHKYAGLGMPNTLGCINVFSLEQADAWQQRYQNLKDFVFFEGF